MKIIASLFLLLLLALPAPGQRISALPEITGIPTNHLFIVADPGVQSYKATLNTLVKTIYTNISGSIAAGPASGGIWNFINGVTVGGTLSASNVTLTTIPGTGDFMAIGSDGKAYKTNAPAGSGDVSTAQLNASSNGLFAVETTRNAAVSNAVVALIGSGSGVTISNANILWVDKGGTNGVRGRLDRPFPHPTHAWSNAVSGDTVVVLPGVYHGCSNLMKAGVNWQGIGWPMLTYTNRTNDRGTGIFDERFSGATTSIIHGFNYIYSTGIPGTNGDGTACCVPTNISFAGVLSVTNPLSMVDFQFGDIDFMCIPLAGGSQCINAQDGKLTRVKGRSMRDMFYSSNYYVGLDDGGDPVYRASSAEGVYWEQGEFYLDVDNIQMAKYSIYGKCPVLGLNRTNNMWLTLGNSSGSFYLQTDCTNPPNWKTWTTVKNLSGSTNIFSFGTAVGIAVQILGGGSHYINAQKIVNGNHSAPPISISGGGQSIPRVWIAAQKVTFDRGVKDNESTSVMCSIVDGINYLNVQEWEDAGGATAGLDLNGGSTFVSGGRLAVTNGVGVRFGIGATARLNNMTIDTSNTSLMTNAPVFVSTNGLILNNCVLVAPAAAPSIMAVSAKSVLAYGVLTSNKTNSPNVTVQVGSQIVDSNVR